MPSSEIGFVQFLKWDELYETEKPFQVFAEDDITQNGERTTNLTWEEKAVTVDDFRGNEKFVDIDDHGFTSRSLRGFEILEHAEDIESRYIPAVQKLLQKVLVDAGTVFVYDWRIRDSSTHYTNGRVNFSDKSSSLLPSNYAHVDMAPISIVKRVQDSFAKDADAIFAQRIRAINVWKPINNPVDQWALAVCDGTTIDSSELIETDSVRGGNITTLYYALHSAKQKWHFLRRQTPEEVLIFKHFDSKVGVKNSFAMHSSIRHRDVPADAQPRRSIEIRALVFSDYFEPSKLES